MGLALKRPNLLRAEAFVGGSWVSSDKRLQVRNPSTGELVGEVPSLGAEDTRRAIRSAAAALPAWAARTAADRSRILRCWFDLMLAHQDDLAAIMTAEQGKPLAESRSEIAYAASFLEWFAEEGKRLYGDVIPTYAADKRIVCIKQPVGVVGAITPWNFPAAMITRKVGPALAAGCSVVIKPASATPLTAYALCVLAEEAGVPAGVLHCITGPAAAIAGEMAANPLVRKISFTGSTEIGRDLMAACAPSIKKLSLELGGNAPFIVFDDADVDAAVEGALASKYRNAGQTCVCTNRIYVQDAVYDTFVSRLAAATAKLKVGDGAEEGTVIGPLINAAAVRKVGEHVEDALSRGARVVLAGGASALGEAYFNPVVLADVTSDMLVCREETFGPLAAVVRFTSEEEVLAMANDSEFGLAAYFYSRGLSRVWRVAEALECGMVGVNTGLISSEVAPFGGIKQSGLGREGSKFGIDEYVEVKYLCIGGLESPRASPSAPTGST